MQRETITEVSEESRIWQITNGNSTCFQDKQLNAWCMPGGKVAVYTGILPVTKDDNGLAVVMGHEISHALAGHGNERISQATLAQYGGQLVGASLSNGQMASIFNQLYPVGAQVGLLAYGRKQESEADQMGLYLMAMAGYDPRTAPAFWQKNARCFWEEHLVLRLSFQLTRIRLTEKQP